MLSAVPTRHAARSEMYPETWTSNLVQLSEELCKAALKTNTANHLN